MSKNQINNSNIFDIDSHIKHLILPSLREYTSSPNLLQNENLRNDDTNKYPGEEVLDYTFPDIYDIFQSTCNTLSLNPKIFILKVYPSWEIQGYAFISNPPFKICVSSGAVERLKPDELKFLIGHEIGHCLMGNLIKYNKNGDSLEDYIFSRRLEICADRFGFLSINNIEVAQNTIMKLMTGLDDRYLKIDITKFLQNKSELAIGNDYKYSTHPPGHLRIKFLYNFAAIEDLINKGPGHSDIDKANKTIEKELDDNMDKAIIEEIEESIAELLIWLTALPVLMKQSVKVPELSKNLSIPINKDLIVKAIRKINSYPDSDRANFLKQEIHQLYYKSLKIGPRRTKDILLLYKKYFPTVLFEKDSFYESLFD